MRTNGQTFKARTHHKGAIIKHMSDCTSTVLLLFPHEKLASCDTGDVPEGHDQQKRGLLSSFGYFSHAWAPLYFPFHIFFSLMEMMLHISENHSKISDSVPQQMQELLERQKSGFLTRNRCTLNFYSKWGCFSGVCTNSRVQILWKCGGWVCIFSVCVNVK